MKSQYEQLLLRRRAKSGASEMADNSDGLLDLLCNVVGVLVLVSSLAGVFAATSAVNIQAPMRTQTKKQFRILQATNEGIWDLQPAIDRMALLDRERVEKVRECENLLPPESTICDQGLNNWQKEEQINGVKMTINHEKGQIIKVGDPTFSSEDIQNNDDLLDEIMKQLQSEDKALFVVLESTGFPMYRAIKRSARKYKVPLGWEPWYGGDPINFWGNSGRTMSIQ